MSYDNQEHQIGDLLDRALGEEMGLYFQPHWHPKFKADKRRKRVWRISLTSAAVLTAGVLALPLTVRLPEGHGVANNVNLAAAHVPTAVVREISSLTTAKYTVEGMSPIYGSYPVASPTGHSLSLKGHFVIGAITGNRLSIDMNNHLKVQGGMLFNQGSPVYTFSGSQIASGQPVTTNPTVQQANGVWYPRGDTSINTFSAAGSHVYVTHGNTWSDLVGYAKEYWMTSPSSPPANTVDSIAGLPSHPDQALLMEQNPSGLSRGFITRNGGRSWTAWRLGAQSVSNLIAIRSQYWAVLNGTLAWSANGLFWHNMLSLNVKQWQVETYAVDPANPSVIAVALIPISGDGVGPVLETTNGGRNWSEIPHFPAIGAAPSTMIMTPNGDIAALINLNGPVIVRYSARSQSWSTFPIPAGKSDLGLGQLGATPNGNLLYGAPGGSIYQWIRQSQQWLVIAPPEKDPSQNPATPLQSIGNNQVLAGYPGGWYIFWEPQSETSGSINAPASVSSNAETPKGQAKNP